MAIGPKGPPRKPGLSIRGRVIHSTFRGVPYTRPWPAKRPTKPGSSRAWHAKAFGAANRACKITAAMIYGAHWAATRGTPLLPRDLMIAFMYGRAFALTLEDGRIIRPVAARNDVSKSLDMIGNQAGMTLVRGKTHWETQIPSPRNLGAMLVLNGDKTGQDYSSAKAVPWDTAHYDVGGWSNLPAQPTALIVPAGVNFVKLNAVLQITGLTSGQRIIGLLRKNGSGAYYGSTNGNWSGFGGTDWIMLPSPALPVAEGDVFTVELITPGDSSLNLAGSVCAFTIEQAG